MKKRLRWLTIPSISRPSLAKVVAGLRQDEFTEHSTAGFIIERSTKDFVEGKFVERYVRAERLEDPFGNVSVVENINYNQTHFLLSANSELLEIHDSPRSLGPTLNALSVHFPTISVSTVKLDVVSWMRNVSGELDSMEISAAFIGEVAISNNVQAKIGLKGTGGVIDAARSMMKGRHFSFSKIEFQGVLHGHQCKCQLLEEGRALILKGPESILDVLREALPNHGSR